MNNSRGSHEEDVDVRDYDENMAEGDYQDNDQGDEGSECNISNEDLDQIANLVDIIKEIYAEVDEDNVKTVSTEIDNNIQAIMMDLGNKLTPDLSQEVAAVYNLNAKFAFYNVCFGKAFEILHKVDPKLALVFSRIQDTNVTVVSKFTDKLLALHPTIADLIQRLDEAEGGNEIKSPTVRGKTSEDSEELKRLREEHRGALDKLSRQAKEIERLKTGGSSAARTPTASSKRTVSRPGGAPEFEDANDYKNSKRDIVKPHLHSDEFRGSGSAADGPGLLNWIDMHQNIGRTNRRIVTLKQAKDLIEEIAASKHKYDLKCQESPIPRETMEQHMYSYLSQKFGLRSIVVEWATALVNCLKIYWSKDNDIAVFAMILRNECDEEFRNIQKQVRSTIQDLFKIALKTKLPTKKNSEIAKLLDEKFKGYITEEECLEILRYIYKDDDFKEIREKVEKSMAPGEIKASSILGSTKDVGKKVLTIKYKEFEKTILDFQLKNHRNFLSRFISLFRVYDTQNYGYINEEQFRDMMGTIDTERRLDVDRIINAIDTQEMGVLPFSACVSVFSTEPIHQDQDGITTVLHFISAEGA